MCGIFACVDTTHQDVSDIAISGLMRLRYRGYDSFGFAYPHGGELQVTRSLEALDSTVCLPESASVIGHTRWATHGKVILDNCHPWLPGNNEFALIHNGVVENYRSLSESLSEPRSKPLTENRNSRVISDTAVIGGLLAKKLSQAESRVLALQAVMAMLQGANSVVVLFADGQMLGARDGPPLIVAQGRNRMFISSDASSLSGWADEMSALDYGQQVSICGGQASIVSSEGVPGSIDWQPLKHLQTNVETDDFSHHMAREVMQQWRTLPTGVTPDLGELSAAVGSSRTVLICGAGGAFITARQIARLLCEISGTRAIAVPAYELESVRTLIAPGDLFIAISQSGETADTIRATQLAKQWGCTTSALTNMPLSTLEGLVDIAVRGDVGPEICVLSTKSASAQIAFGYLLGHEIAGDRHHAALQLAELSQSLAGYLGPQSMRSARQIAMKYESARHIYILGQGIHGPTAQMAALNIKEASYVHAESFSAGELKHGVLALVTEGTLVILYPGEPLGRSFNAAAEVLARGASLLGVAAEPNDLYDDFLPMPIVSDPLLESVAGIIPGQFLAYQLAVTRGLNPDQPRNLAKSVTVL